MMSAEISIIYRTAVKEAEGNYSLRQKNSVSSSILIVCFRECVSLMLLGPVLIIGSEAKISMLHLQEKNDQASIIHSFLHVLTVFILY